MKSTIAILTYNLVDGNRKNGWQEGAMGKVFLLQNTRGLEWGSDFAPSGYTISDGNGGSDRRRINREQEIEVLWQELRRVASDIGHYYIYLGREGSYRFVELARELDLKRVTFVSCKCTEGYCETLFKRYQFERAGIMPCGCGGHATMRGLMERHLATGVARPEVWQDDYPSARQAW